MSTSRTLGDRAPLMKQFHRSEDGVTWILATPRVIERSELRRSLREARGHRPRLQSRTCVPLTVTAVYARALPEDFCSHLRLDSGVYEQAHFDSRRRIRRSLHSQVP